MDVTSHQLIKDFEGFVPTVELDFNGIPTIGNGFALLILNKYKPAGQQWEVRHDLDRQLQAVGLPASTANDKRILQQYADVKNGIKRPVEPLSQLSLRFDVIVADRVAKNIEEENDQFIRRRLGGSVWDNLDGERLIGVREIYYVRGGMALGDGVAEALQQGNLAEAARLVKAFAPASILPRAIMAANFIEFGQPNEPNKYAVMKGDTFGSIAQTLGVSIGALQQANPQIEDINRLSIGQQITIPGDATLSGGDAVSDLGGSAGDDLLGAAGSGGVGGFFSRVLGTSFQRISNLNPVSFLGSLIRNRQTIPAGIVSEIIAQSPGMMAPRPIRQFIRQPELFGQLAIRAQQKGLEDALTHSFSANGSIATNLGGHIGQQVGQTLVNALIGSEKEVREETERSQEAQQQQLRLSRRQQARLLAQFVKKGMKGM